MEGIERPQISRQQHTCRREQVVVHSNEIQPAENLLAPGEGAWASRQQRS
jgi:hypothetical protein